MAETTEATTYRIQSTKLIHGPGMLAWLRNLYRTQAKEAIKAFAAALPMIPLGLAVLYLEGLVEPVLEDDGKTAALTLPEDGGVATMLDAHILGTTYNKEK